MSVSKRLRFVVLREHGYVCFYCGRRPPSVTLEIDHRIPVCAGGLDVLENLVPACWDCNRGKGPIQEHSPSARSGVYSWDEIVERDIEDGAPECFPDWMLPRFRKPINFDFDIFAVMDSIAKPRCYPDLGMEPFNAPEEDLSR